MSFNLQYLRGYVKGQLIDQQLTDEKMERQHKFFEKLKPSVGDRRDAIFGCVIGIVFAKMSDVFVILQRQPTEEELEEIRKAITKSFSEIKSRVNQTFT